MRWTATTASHSLLLNPEREASPTPPLATHTLLFIHRYISLTLKDYLFENLYREWSDHALYSFRWLPTLVNTLTRQDFPQQDLIRFSLLSAVSLPNSSLIVRVKIAF